MLKIYILIIAIFLIACNSTPKQQAPSIPSKAEDVSIAKKVYFFQHNILPEWTYTTDGSFYQDLLQSDLSRLKMAATEVISQGYANGITSEVLEDGGSVLIKFPKPKAMANCFYVLIQKSKDGFNFYTYEKTMSFGGNDPVVGVVGSWSPEGEHTNLGGRTYLKASDFVADILSKKG